MDLLVDMKCIPPRAGEPKVTEAEMAQFAPQVPDWQIVERNQVKRLDEVSGSETLHRPWLSRTKSVNWRTRKTIILQS